MKVNAMCFAKLVKLLEEGEYSRTELAEKTGLHPLTVGEYCKAMKKEGAVHIAEWVQDSNNRWSIEILKLGSGKDAKKPAPKSKAQIKSEYDAKIRMLRNPLFRLAA